MAKPFVYSTTAIAKQEADRKLAILRKVMEARANAAAAPE